MRIGLNVPSGLNVQPIQVKYLGFADVPTGGSTKLNVKILLFQGQELPIIDDLNATFAPDLLATWSKYVGIVLGTIYVKTQ